MKSLFIFTFLSLLSFNLYSASVESVVKKAREMESKEVIKCNPTGKNDGLAPIVAFKALKPGMILQLTPRIEPRPKKRGFPPLVVPTDRIILTHDPEKGRINYPVVLQGDGCVIRNANLSSLRVNSDAVVVDSIIGNIGAGNERGRGKLICYNTILRSLGTGSGKPEVEIKHCTINGSIRCKTNLKLTISESVLFSDIVNFYLIDYHNRKGRLTLDNNIIHGNSGYAKMEESPSSKKMGVVCLDAKDIKKLWSITFLGENIYKVPKFQERSSLLTEDSPGQGKGIIPEEHTVLITLKKQEEEADAKRKKERDEANEKRKVERDEEAKKRAAAKRKWKENARKRKEWEKTNKKGPDDINIGGVPEPPK